MSCSSRAGLETQLFDLDDLLSLTRLALFLLALVLEFAEVQQPAYWRDRVRGDFHQVQTALVGHA